MAAVHGDIIAFFYLIDISIEKQFTKSLDATKVHARVLYGISVTV